MSLITTRLDKPDRNRPPRPVTPDLETRPMSSILVQYECPTCESACSPESARHQMLGPFLDRRVTTLACEHCGATHRADYARRFEGAWERVSEVVSTPPTRANPFADSAAA